MQHLVIAVPVVIDYDAQSDSDGIYPPKDPQPAVKSASTPCLVEAETPQEAARLLAQKQNPGFPAEYLVLSGDTATVTLTAA